MWVVFTALKTNLEVAQDPLGLPPNWRFENIVTAWNVGKFGRYFINSVITTVPIVILVVSLSCLAGYGLARLRMPGRMLIFYFFLIGLMVPFTAIMIPLFYILRDIGVLAYLLGDDPAADGHIAALRHLLHARLFQRPALRLDRRRQDRRLQRFRRFPPRDAAAGGTGRGRPGRLQLHGLLERLPAASDLLAVGQAAGPS